MNLKIKTKPKKTPKNIIKPKHKELKYCNYAYCCNSLKTAAGKEDGMLL